MEIYTRTGDDGTTGLLFGGRVSKASAAPAAYGDVDEAQATIGVARSLAERGTELDAVLVEVEADLWVVMAELATDPSNRHKLTAGATLVTAAMVEHLETTIDRFQARYEPPREFVVPGQEPVSARLDLARTVTRRAERSAVVALEGVTGTEVVRYLNRLSDLLFVLARWHEGGWVAAREVARGTAAAGPEQQDTEEQP